jgi:hypothetical protein
MWNVSRWWCMCLLTIGSVLYACTGSGSAQDKKPYEKHDASALNQSLRDVINAGAKMFNEQGDHAGCYRLYQGSLLSVRPFLTKELQTKIDVGITNAEKMPSFADRAFELRRVLDEVRASAKSADKTGDKTKVDTGDKSKGDSADKGQISGKLTFQGKAVTGGYFVTLISNDGKKFSSAIQKDGAFQFKTPIPLGTYGVAIEPIPGEAVKGVALPARYSAQATSSLTILVQGGKQQVELNLLK